MVVDLSNLDLATRRRVDEIFRGDHQLQVLRAIERQQRAAAINYLHKKRAPDGIGPQTFAIDPVFDAIWRRFYGREYSADPDLMKFLIRRNPEIRVFSGGSKIQVGYLPSTYGASRIQFGYQPSSQSKRPLWFGTNENGRL